MAEFKDEIPAAGGKIEFLWQPNGRIDFQISGTGPWAMYMVAVSMDGRHLLGEVPAVGLGGTAVYPQPSVVTYIQSDDQRMWGRNCPACEKYFRTTHIFDMSVCPYCAETAPSLTFISKAQRVYIAACYDAFARAVLTHQSTSLDVASITDQTPAWHYSEEKQQLHFKCKTDGCGVETDILGRYGFCPRCGRTNAGHAFKDLMSQMLTRWDETNRGVSDRGLRRQVWEDLTIKSVTELETLAKHLRRKLLTFPMTRKRRQQLETLNFQSPLQADESLRQWFDISILQWNGDVKTPARAVQQSELPFVTKMIQRRHILIHNGGMVDEDYLRLSGDTQARLHEQIRIRGNEAKRFVELMTEMGLNLLDGIENGFAEAR
jgi:hypothetical protein